MTVKELFNLLNSLMLKGLSQDAEVWLTAPHNAEACLSAQALSSLDFDEMCQEDNVFRSATEVHVSTYDLSKSDILLLTTDYA